MRCIKFFSLKAHSHSRNLRGTLYKKMPTSRTVRRGGILAGIGCVAGLAYFGLSKLMNKLEEDHNVGVDALAKWWVSEVRTVCVCVSVCVCVKERE
jgi:hypothetical protein